MVYSYFWWNFDKGVYQKDGIGPYGAMLDWFLLRHIVEVRAMPTIESDGPLQTSFSTALANTDEESILIPSRLPIELIEQIFEVVDDLTDLVSLCVASRTFWDIGHRRIRTLLEYHLNRSSWAGDRILNTAGPFDLVDRPFPEGMLTVEEKETFDEDLYHDDFDKRYFSLGPIPVGYNVLRKAFTSRLSEQEYSVVHRLITVWPDSEQSRDLNHLTMQDLPPLQTQVFRNLTRRLYVRGDTMYKFIQEQRRRMDIRDWSMAVIVADRVDWFPVESAPGLHEDDLQPGSGNWAGHRFDIQRVDHFDPHAGGQEWKDVSDAVAALWEEDLDIYYQETLDKQAGIRH